MLPFNSWDKKTAHHNITVIVDQMNINCLLKTFSTKFY